MNLPPFGGRPETVGTLRGRRFEDEFGGHRDRPLQTSINRTLVCEDPLHTRSGLPLIFVGFESHPHVNASDHKDVILQLNLTDSFADQASTGRVDLTRLQRASKGSGKSACRGGDDVVECGCSWFRNVGRDLIMLRYGAMDTKNNRLRFSRKIRLAHRPFHSLDSDFGTLDHFGNESSPQFGLRWNSDGARCRSRPSYLKCHSSGTSCGR